MNLLLERWCIDGSKTPYLVENVSLKVSCADVQWSLYSTPCSRKLAFVPRSTSVISQGGFASLDSRSGIRVGSRIILTKGDFHNSSFKSTCSQMMASRTKDNILSDEEISDPKTPESREIAIPKDATILTEYCEEVAHQANLLVVCRRKIPKPESPETVPEKKSRYSRNTRREHNFSDSSDDDQESGSDNDESDAEGPAFSNASSLKSAASSNTLRSGSEESGCSFEESSDVESGNASSLPDDFKSTSDSEESNDGLDFCPSSEDDEEGDDGGIDSMSLLSMSTSESSDDEFNDTSSDREDNSELGSNYEYPVGITGQIPASEKNCDSCGERQRETWYHCTICQHNDYDLCHDCVKMGQWCWNKEHQLYEEVSDEGVVSVISWSRFVHGQELLIFDTTSTMEEPIFTHSLSESATLHQSAPVIHPLVPLVVWPICAEKLLFAHASQNCSSKKRSFSLQSFKATSSKGTLFLMSLQ